MLLREVYPPHPGSSTWLHCSDLVPKNSLGKGVGQMGGRLYHAGNCPACLHLVIEVTVSPACCSPVGQYQPNPNPRPFQYTCWWWSIVIPDIVHSHPSIVIPFLVFLTIQKVIFTIPQGRSYDTRQSWQSVTAQKTLRCVVLLKTFRIELEL